jgi:hypothetical protein
VWRLSGHAYGGAFACVPHRSRLLWLFSQHSARPFIARATCQVMSRLICTARLPRPVWPLLPGRLAESVMVPAGNNDQFRSRGAVDQAVDVVNASGSVS